MPVLVGSPPVLERVTLRTELQRYEMVYPTFYFHDPDGDAVEVHREVIAREGALAGRFNPVSRINVSPADQIRGAVWVGGWACGAQPSATTVRAYILDRGGNRSNTVDYTVTCKGQQGQRNLP